LLAVKNNVTKDVNNRYLFVLQLVNKYILFMGFFRVLLCIVFPPLAVIDKGCGSILIVFILTCLGWIPGVIAALIINNNPNN